MSTSPSKKLNLPLPEEMHRALFAEARRAGVPATRLARTAVENWLTKRVRERRKEEIRRFAIENAGPEVDLDPVVEDAAPESLHALSGDLRETG